MYFMCLRLDIEKDIETCLGFLVPPSQMHVVKNAKMYPFEVNSTMVSAKGVHV